MSISTYLSIIISNVDGINAPIKRHRVAEWIKKHLLFIYHANGSGKKSQGRNTHIRQNKL